jgi:hypothetical protein
MDYSEEVAELLLWFALVGVKPLNLNKILDLQH